MKIIHLSFSPSPNFPNPILKPYFHSIPRIGKPQFLKSHLDGQPNYTTLLTPKPISNPNPNPNPQRFANIPLVTDQNTCSDVLRLMDALGFAVTPDIYSSLVDECTRKMDAFQGGLILAHLKRNRGVVGFFNGSSGLCLFNRILMMFVICGRLDVARQVFDDMPQRDSISLSIMIGGLVKGKDYEQALGLFVGLRGWFVRLPCDLALRVVMVCVLEACGHLKNVYIGKMVHGRMLKMGCHRELLSAIALMEFYGKCRCLSEANSVFFDQIEVANHCSDTRVWNVAIANNSREACFNEVIWIFREIGRAGVKKNDRTFSTVLKACGRASDGKLNGKQVHANAIKLALDTHIPVMCGLVNMYGKVGELKDARKVFDMMANEEKSSACWYAMVSGFINQGFQVEAIKLLYEMKAIGIEPPQSMIDEVIGGLR